MKPKLSFFDKLLKRNTKTVVEKDKSGKVIEQVTYTFDSHGGIVSASTSRPDERTGALKKYKDKTYVRREDGQYDPDKTTYFDDQGRETTVNQYYRDRDGMLFCDQQKYGYSKSGAQLRTKSSTTRYDGGLWTKIRARKNHHDEYGHLIEREDFERSSQTGELVRVKDKTYVRRENGEYDPKETSYYDMQGRIIDSKQYSREQTEIDEKPLLTAVEKKYSYAADGTRKEDSSEKSFHLGALWVPAEAFAKSEEAARAKKQERIAQLEAELAQLKSPATPPRGKDGR